jgi:hypothetical protein
VNSSDYEVSYFVISSLLLLLSAVSVIVLLSAVNGVISHGRYAVLIIKNAMFCDRCGVVWMQNVSLQCAVLKLVLFKS